MVPQQQQQAQAWRARALRTPDFVPQQAQQQRPHQRGATEASRSLPVVPPGLRPIQVPGPVRPSISTITSHLPPPLPPPPPPPASPIPPPPQVHPERYPSTPFGIQPPPSLANAPVVAGIPPATFPVFTAQHAVYYLNVFGQVVPWWAAYGPPPAVSWQLQQPPMPVSVSSGPSPSEPAMALAALAQRGSMGIDLWLEICYPRETDPRFGGFLDNWRCVDCQNDECSQWVCHQEAEARVRLGQGPRWP